MPHPTPPEEYANKIVTGLNSFLDHSELSIQLEKCIEQEIFTKLVFGTGEEEISDDITPDDAYSFEDGRYVFTFGLHDKSHLIIETDIENVNAIDCDEHVGEAVGCFIEAAN